MGIGASQPGAKILRLFHNPLKIVLSIKQAFCCLLRKRSRAGADHAHGWAGIEVSPPEPCVKSHIQDENVGNKTS